METTFTSPYLPARVESERTQLRLPSRPEWIQPAAEYLKDKAVLCGACLEAQGLKLTIALLEALSNAVVHGNLEVSSELKEQGEDCFAEALAARAADPRYASRCVDVVVDYDGERCRWILTDEGPGFDVAKVLAQDVEAEAALLRASGRGIMMMRAFLDEVCYEAEGRRVILTLRRASGDEKRRQPRQPVQQRIRVVPRREDGSVDWDAAYEAVTRNYSLDGLAFLQERLAVTDRIIISIDAAGQPLEFPAEVRHWRTIADNVVEIGCRFPAPTSPPPPPVQATAGVEDLIGPVLESLRGRQAVEDDRRSSTRVGYNQRIEIQGRPGSTPVVGFARDLSRSGISFITTAPLPLESALLALPQGGGPEPARIRVQIVRCGKIMEGFYDVAAKFLEAVRGK